MAEWSPGRVEERLRKAIAMKARLFDAELPPGTGGAGGIGVGRSEAEGDDVVTLAAESLSWLRWLDPEDAQIVIARLEGGRWKMICWRFGISRPTADRRWRYTLAIIAWRLNGHAASPSTPSLRSMLSSRAA